VKKVFHFDAPSEWYACDAAIVCCFDSRFDVGFSKFLKRMGIVQADPIRIAGGAKVLVAPDRESDREFVLEQIRSSIRLHGTRRVILVLHSDCGAYGRLARFQGDAAAEAAHHAAELHRAAANLKAAIPGIEVQGYFADFEGIWDAEIGSAQGAESPAVA
jgi:carbonic anhydrase